MVPTNKTVLVVEDDDLLRKIIIDQLTLEYPSIPAVDGEEALKEVKRQKPGIVILDLLMPNLDGFGFLEQLRANTDPAVAQTAVLVVSNLSDSQSMEKAKKFGVLEFYVKSEIQTGVIINRIKRYFTKGT